MRGAWRALPHQMVRFAQSQGMCLGVEEQKNIAFALYRPYFVWYVKTFVTGEPSSFRTEPSSVYPHALMIAWTRWISVACRAGCMGGGGLA